jgi:hypothetical protein
MSGLAVSRNHRGVSKKPRIGIAALDICSGYATALGTALSAGCWTIATPTPPADLPQH